MIADSSMQNHLHEQTTDWRNVRATSVFTFVDSLQFTIYMWSFWPYLQQELLSFALLVTLEGQKLRIQLDPTMGTTYVGLILAASGVGEAVFAFVFGAWSNKLGRINPPVFLSIIMSLIGNIVYLFLGLIPTSWIFSALLFSRFLNGAGSGNRGCFRALVAANSLGPDRAKALASSGGAALVGLTIGPAVQVCFNWIGPEGYKIGSFALSKYTGPAILAIIINISTYFYVYYTLDDSLAPKRKVMTKSTSTMPIRQPVDAEQGEAAPKTVAIPAVLLRMDVLAVVICMGTRTIRMLVTANIESIGAPYTEIMFGYNHDEALHWNSIVQGVVGGVTIVTFCIYTLTSYTKKVSERTNCIGAIVALLAFYLFTMPWPFLPGAVDCEPFIGNGTKNWTWCGNLAPVNQWVYYISYAVLYGVALSVLNNSLQALYSRVLGSAPQGTMQGVNQAVGCVSRILGPILMSSTFSSWGPRATWATVAALLGLTLLIWLVAYRRLTPLECRWKPAVISNTTEPKPGKELTSQTVEIAIKRPSLKKTGYTKF